MNLGYNKHIKTRKTNQIRILLYLSEPKFNSLILLKEIKENIKKQENITTKRKKLKLSKPKFNSMILLKVLQEKVTLAGILQYSSEHDTNNLILLNELVVYFFMWHVARIRRKM